MDELILNPIVENVLKNYSLQDNFCLYCRGVVEVMAIDHAGLAQLTADGQQFQVMAEWSVEEKNLSPGRRFPRAGTVGDLVLRQSGYFSGPTIDAVRAFPETQDSLSAGGYQSNFVARVRDAPGMLVFMLSRQPTVLANDNARLIEQSLGHLRELVDSSSRMTELLDFDDELKRNVGEFLTDYSAQNGRHPTLKQIERAYLQHLSQTSRFRVEGVLGGASLSGLKPSTLRYRLERLNNGG